jgi:hypothetical protein
MAQQPAVPGPMPPGSRKMARNGKKWDGKIVTREAEEVTSAVEHCRDAYLRPSPIPLLNIAAYPYPKCGGLIISKGVGQNATIASMSSVPNYQLPLPLALHCDKMDSLINCHYIYVVDIVGPQSFMAFRPNFPASFPEHLLQCRYLNLLTFNVKRLPLHAPPRLSKNFSSYMCQ